MISRRAFLAGAAASAAALTYPAWGTALGQRASAAPATCELALENKSLPGTVHAYVTGRELGTDRWVLSHPSQPNGTSVADYYRTPVTNRWSRVVHANSPTGYAFPYYDVRPDGEPDVSGTAHDGNPRRFTVSVGS